MATNTTPDNLLKPQATDQIAPLETLLSNMQDSVQTALTNRNKNMFLLYATRAAMNAVPGTQVGQHATVYADSTTANNGDYTWSGSAWIAAAKSGLVPITPTSVSGATLSGSRVVFSAVASFTVSGIFSSAYRNYLVKWRVDTRSGASGNGNNVELIQLAASGVTNTTGYSWRRMVANSTTVSQASGTSQTSWNSFAADATLTTAKQLEIFSPALADRTMVFGQGMETDASGSSTVLDYSGTHASASAFDGLTMSTGLGTLTGSMWVYGYNE